MTVSPLVWTLTVVFIGGLLLFGRGGAGHAHDEGAAVAGNEGRDIRVAPRAAEPVGPHDVEARNGRRRERG